MTDQWQNSDDITDSFNMSDLLASFNKASLNEASFNKVLFSESELPTFYQYLDCSHINIQT